MERRSFLETSAAALIAQSMFADDERSGDMIYRTLGRTGERVSAIGMGGYHIGVARTEQDSTRLVRSAAVHVGIAAQGYLFPAPTGVVDYQLRVPGDTAVVSTLNGYATYGVFYDETDFALPLASGALAANRQSGDQAVLGHDAPRRIRRETLRPYR